MIKYYYIFYKKETIVMIMKGMVKRMVSALSAAAVAAPMIAGTVTAAGNGSEIPSDMGQYIPNDIDFNYESMFENYGIEKVVRDSVIGGERSSLFNDGWKFFKTQDMEADYSGINGAVDDSSWTNVTLPHDFQVIQQGNMGSRYAMLKDYRGWYKKSFCLPEELRDKRIAVRFDGIYQASEVFINGQALPEYENDDPDASPYSGTHYYGYKTFEVNLTDYLNFGEDAPNVITVSVKDQHTNSRWYTGSGINRNVWLTVSDKVHTAFNGTYITYDLNDDYTSAEVNVKTEIRNESDRDANVYIKQTLYNNGAPVDTVISDANLNIISGGTETAEQRFTLADPKLWGLGNDESDNLYSLYTEVLVGDNIDTAVTADTYISEFGFRDIQWDKDTGVYLNGEHIKLQGVCMHENLGSLGSANNAAAIERQIVILKRMGVNAVRTAHNICTPELLTICNRLGMLVFEEAFDSWDDTKDGAYSPGGQGIFLDSYESDIRHMVRRDRNNPCVFMWSIGNEIVQTVWGNMNEVWPKIQTMLDCIMQEDPDGGRYVTLAQMQWTTDFSQEISAKICDYLAENYTDCGVMGENYREYYLQQAHDNYPGYRMLGTESSSAMRSRGVYHEGTYVFSHDDLQISSLDNSGPAYYIPADYMYMFDANRDWYAGHFVWSGFDYIGEPSPYDTKNSYFGIVDTAGLPKDVYYFYKSVWNKNEDTVHILPYWDKNDGDIADVIVYSDAGKVDLYYVPEEGGNYEPQHLTKTLDRKDSYAETWGSSSKPEYSERLRFDFSLTYHPGTIYAVAEYDDGHKSYTKLATPSDAAKLGLRPDRSNIAADGADMTFVEINALDKDGNLVALDSDRVKVEVTGAAELVSIDTGNSVEYDSYQSETRKLFNGKAVAYLRSNGEAGEINIKVTALNMEPAELTLNTRTVENISTSPEINKSNTKADSTLDKSIPLGSTIYARKLEMTPAEGSPKTLTEKNPTMVLNYRLLPENVPSGTKLADGDLQFRVIGTEGYVRVNNAGIEVDKENQTITVTGLKPGTFRIYGTYTNGEKQIQLLSTYTITNESAISDDPSLTNDAYRGVNAVKLDPSSNNQSYTVDYDKGVITGIYRADDTLVYKDVEFGTDYSRELILNCYNTGSAGTVEVYVDDELRTTLTIPEKEAAVYSKHIYPLSGITGTHDITFRNVVQGTKLAVESFRFTGSGTDPYDAYSRIEGESFDYYTASNQVPEAAEYTDSTGTKQGTLSIVDNCGVFYKGIDFGEEGSDLLEICMKRVEGSGNIAITIGDMSLGAKELNPDWESMTSYKKDEYTVYRYRLDKKYTGVQDVELFAYPGAATEIDWFRFVDPNGMLMNNTVFNSSDNYSIYGSGSLTYGRQQLTAKLGTSDGNSGIKVDVTDLIKSNPSGTELLASAAFTVSGSANAKLFLENQDGEKAVIGEITDRSAGGTEDAAIYGKTAFAYDDTDTVYLCLTADSSQINLKKLALAYNAAGEAYILPGAVKAGGENKIIGTTARYSIKTSGEVSRDAALKVMLDGKELLTLTYDSAEGALCGETETEISAGLYGITYELISGTADITALNFEIAEQASKIELVNNTFADKNEADAYTTYTKDDGSMSGNSNITVSGFASGWNEFNGIKTDITSKVKGLSGKRFGGSADVYTTAGGEVKMFIEAVTPEGAVTRYKLDSISGTTGNISLKGTAEDVVFGDNDTVYLCITQWSGYTSFDNILLYYYAEMKEETFFTHTFSNNDEAELYTDYDETIGHETLQSNGSRLSYKSNSSYSSNNGVKTDVTEYVKAHNGGTFTASADFITYWVGSDAKMFIEVVSESGAKKQIALDSAARDDIESGAVNTLAGRTQLTIEAGDKVYLCITNVAQDQNYDNITFSGKYTENTSPDDDTRKKTQVFRHTFNKEKAAQTALYEPYRTGGGTVGGANATVLKYTNSDGSVSGIKINITDKYGLKETLSGLTFGASAQVEPGGWNSKSNVKMFFEVVGTDGTRTIDLYEAVPGTDTIGALTDSETGVDLGKSWLQSPVSGESVLSFTDDDKVYLCITSSENVMWLDDITLYYINEQKPTDTPKPTGTPEPTDEPNHETIEIVDFDKGTCSGTVVLSDKVTAGDIMIAAYERESGKCVGVRCVPYDEISENRLTFGFNNADAFVKVFVWDSLESMKPLFPAVETK